jgi:hypothetical protein
MTCRCPDFRGINAAASLKLAAAWKMVAGMRSLVGDFRGINAAASLKLPSLAIVETLFGLTSAASTPRPH